MNSNAGGFGGGSAVAVNTDVKTPAGTETPSQTTPSQPQTPAETSVHAEETPAAPQSIVGAIDSLHTPFINKVAVELIVGKEEYHYNAVIVAKVGEGRNLEYHLESADGTFSKTNASGRFTEVPPVAGGTYYAYVVNKDFSVQSERQEVQKFGKRKPIDKITPEQLTAIYMSGDPAKLTASVNNKFRMKGKYTAYTISYTTDTSSENNIPKTHKEVITKIMMGAWTSVTVTGLEYDALGYVTDINLSFMR